MNLLTHAAHQESNFCPSGNCEHRLVAEYVVSSTATRLELHGSLEKRQGFEGWTSRGTFREMFEWDGKRWEEVESGRHHPYRGDS